MNPRFLSLTALAFALSIVAVTLLTYAQGEEEEAPAEEAPPEVAEEVSPEDYACTIAVREVGYTETQAYQAFLEEYFNFDAASSEQAADAITRYRYLELAIEATFAENALATTNGKDFETVSNEYSNCLAEKDVWLSLARSLSQAYILQSANNKRSFEIIDSLKDLNEKMNTLSDDFTKVFPASFESMDNKLPCYARECVSR